MLMQISIKQAIDAIKNGKMLIIIDDADRENEGDEFVPTEILSASHVNFMATYARGLICISLPKSRLRKLGITEMVESNTNTSGTAFHVSCDARQGITSGISASDRTVTMQKLIHSDAKHEDFVFPGHVFPIAARAQGVLARRGHTEAAADLSALAGFKPSGVIVEVMDDDGSVAKLPKLEEFSDKHQIPIVTIEDLALYRHKNNFKNILYDEW